MISFLLLVTCLFSHFVLLVAGCTQDLAGGWILSNGIISGIISLGGSFEVRLQCIHRALHCQVDVGSEDLLVCAFIATF